MANQYDENTFSLNLSSYTKPKTITDKRKGYVSYEIEVDGNTVEYFQHLIDLYNDSPTNNAVINGMTELIYGEGLDAKDKVRKPDEYAQMKGLIKPSQLRQIITDFKTFGNCAIQVVYNKAKTKIIRWEHFPVETLRAEIANDEGEIQGYYYCADWENVRPNTKLDRLPSFGFGKKSEVNEIMYIKPYRSGSFYYSSVDYHGGLQYCQLEQEIANYHINNVRGGFSPTALLNFNNGVPETEQEAREYKRKILQNLTGSKGEKLIVNFNDSKDSAATIDVVDMSNAHNTYEFISKEAQEKIMLSHRVTSPMLLGIKDNTGLGNNADELLTASILFEKTVVKPFRVLLLEAFDELLAVNGITLDLYFKSLNPSRQELEDEVEDTKEDNKEDENTVDNE